MVAIAALSSSVVGRRCVAADMMVFGSLEEEALSFAPHLTRPTRLQLGRSFVREAGVNLKFLNAGVRCKLQSLLGASARGS